MKSISETPVKKQKQIIPPFMRAISYRIPLPVTKVILYSDDTTYPICPRCLISLEREYVSFCDRCGQKLSWDLLDHAEICYPGYKKE